MILDIVTLPGNVESVSISNLAQYQTILQSFLIKSCEFKLSQNEISHNIRVIITNYYCYITHQVWTLCRDPLECLYEDEDVVDADGEDEEGQDLEDDHGARDAQVAEEAGGRHDREQHDGQARDGQGHLGEMNVRIEHLQRQTHIKTLLLRGPIYRVV